MWIRELRGRALAQIAATTVLVFALAWLSIRISMGWGRVSPIWLPNAAWLVVLLHTPVRRWPALLLAGAVGNTLADLSANDPLILSLGFGPINAAQVLICAAAVRCWLGGRLAVDRPWGLAGFGVVAVASSVAAAGSGALWISMHHHAAPHSLWLYRSMAMSLGLMLFAPPLNVVVESGFGALTRMGKRRQDAAFFAALTAAIGLCWALPQHPMLLLMAPTLVFASLQLEFAAAALAMIMVAGACIAFVAMGVSPLYMSGRTQAEQLLSLQFLLVVAGVVTLPVAAVMKRRRELEAELTASRDALVEVNRQARLAEGLAGIGYWRIAADGDRFEWSDEMFRIYGRDTAEGPPTVTEMDAYVHPEDRELVVQRREQYRDTQAPELGVRLVRPSGEVRHVIARSLTERDHSGRLIARFGTLTDITEIKQAEAAARRSEERYRFLADNAPDMITRTKLAGEIVYISPGSVRVFGHTPEEMLALNAQDMVHPDDFDRVMGGIFRMIEERLPRLPEPLCYRARHKDGRWIWIEANPTLIFDEQGEPIEFIDIVRDVTQTKLFEAELDEARRRAETAAAAKSAFLANMSHELRTPLTSIIGFSRLMGDREDLPSEAKHYAGRISDASEALLAIINDVLDFSKLEAGQVALELQPMSIRRLMDETTGLIAIQAAAKRLELTSELDPAAPELVVGDAARLRQVLLNFLSNAVKFTEEGSVTARAAWKKTRRGGRLRLSVTDTGAGIARENLPRLFERFTQAEVSINRTHGGTGLGLAISKGIVGLMGGRIGVQTRPGQGSTFWFELPMREAQADLAVSEAQPEIDCPQLKVLIVDDTAVNRELVRLMLEPLGLKVQEASGGAEGVKAAMTTPFDLILMDVRMPGVDGLEATRVIRAASEANRTTPILALTADVHPENATACRGAGMDDILAKPIVARELIAKIVEWANPEQARATGTDG
jgi:PAS domain S-box-containing protein